jgi:hypothetical protein
VGVQDPPVEAEMKIVDAWLVPVQEGAGDDSNLLGMLGPDDRAKISRLGESEDRDRAVTARVAARIELGRRLGLTPGAVRLRDEGPPAVEAADLSVSWSHSGTWIALAICEGRSVGVDIEREPKRLDMQALKEIGVTSLEEFVRLEAATKATHCAFGGSWPPGVLVRRLAAPPGYVAAVAAPGDDWTFELHMRCPLQALRERTVETMRSFGGLCYAPLLPLPSLQGWFA